MKIIVMLITAMFILAAFSIFYYIFLKKRYDKKYNLILARPYLDKLFEQSSNLIEASQGINGDISVEKVSFKECDFQFLNDLEGLNQLFNKLRIGSMNYDTGKVQ